MKSLILLPILLLAACSGADQASVDRIILASQLYCARAPTLGPPVVALADAAGVRISVTGQTADVISKACAAIGAIPTTPPPNPAQTPVVAAPIVVAPVKPAA